MSKFYGRLSGNRGETTRCGHSKITASCQSWSGSITTELTYEDDKLMVRILAAEDESTAYGRTIFYGTFEEYINKLTN